MFLKDAMNYVRHFLTICNFNKVILGQLPRAGLKGPNPGLPCYPRTSLIGKKRVF